MTVPSELSEGGSLAESPQITLEDAATEDIRHVIAKTKEGANKTLVSVNQATEQEEPLTEPATSSCTSDLQRMRKRQNSWQ